MKEENRERNTEKVTVIIIIKRKKIKIRESKVRLRDMKEKLKYQKEKNSENNEKITGWFFLIRI